MKGNIHHLMVEEVVVVEEEGVEEGVVVVGMSSSGDWDIQQNNRWDTPVLHCE